MTQPTVEGLFAKARAHAVKRIDRDRRRAPEELLPVLDHLEKRFCDSDLCLDGMEREGVVSRWWRRQFRQVFEMPIKRYLLRLKLDMAEWLLEHSDLDMGHVAYLLGYSQPYNFTRDFGQWTDQSPGEYRDTVRGRPPGSWQRDRRRGYKAKVRERLSRRLGVELPEDGEEAEEMPSREAILDFRGGPEGEEMARRVWNVAARRDP